MIRPINLLYVAIAFCVMGALPSQGVKAQQITPPVEHFGHEMGEKGMLADWQELSAYYRTVADESPRVIIEDLGETTLGEPFKMLTITSEENQQNLDEYHEIQKTLADPRQIESEEHLEELLDRGRTVVLITNHIHSTEVASGQMPPRIIHRLASSDSPEVQRILDETIIVYIPSLNPDGTQMVSDWWHEWKGTEYEGAPLPRLYHHYIGHNNNRDWFAFRQVETRMTVEEAHNRWHPHIVHDIHQMGGSGARFFVPPYIDPLEPNIDHGLVHGYNQLGKYIAAEMNARGKEGIVTNAIFDIFTPARAYMHYHGGVRILSETARANWANPDTVAFEDMSGTGDYDPQERSWNFPNPWEGGVWTLADAVDYMDAGAMALLNNAAKDRDFWVRNFYEVQKRAVGGWDEWPEAWVIPAGQENGFGVDNILNILTTGAVEVHRTQERWTDNNGGGRIIPEGSYVVPMNQPFAAFAHTMLDEGDYPDLRQYEGGPPVRPYDATTHTLPLLMNVEAFPMEEKPDLALSEPIDVPELAFDRREVMGDAEPRIGLYRGYNEGMPQGWQRWKFDQYGVEYDQLRNDDIREGGLAGRYDVIMLQDRSPRAIINGYSEDRMPEPYAGGIGEQGVEALRAFVRNGGRLITIDAATDLAIDEFDLPVSNAVDEFPSEDFYIPGTLLRMDLDVEHRFAGDLDRDQAVFYWRTSRGFDVHDPEVEVVGRYGSGNPKLSGWILGPEFISDKPALVNVPYGEGEVVLFGFQPNYRGWTVGTWPLLFNTITAE